LGGGLFERTTLREGRRFGGGLFERDDSSRGRLFGRKALREEGSSRGRLFGRKALREGQLFEGLNHSEKQPLWRDNSLANILGETNFWENFRQGRA
jgi:hypothetical protein